MTTYKSSSNALQAAIYSALTPDYQVFDGTSFDSDYPYITLGDEFKIDDSAKGAKITEHLVTLNVWSDYNGMKEVKEIAADVVERLTDAPLALAEPFQLTKYRMFNEKYMKDDNGATDLFRGILQLRFTILKG
jgi:hypothetical protein